LFSSLSLFISKSSKLFSIFSNFFIQTQALEPHFSDSAKPKIKIIVERTVFAIDEHKAKNKDVWPGAHGKRGQADAPKKTMQFDESAEEKVR
jgi:hypothetical protein